MPQTNREDISDEIILRCIKGKKDGQRALYETYYRRMYAICLRYTKDNHEAKDLLHDGFIKVFKRISSFKGESAFYPWIKRLFVNHCIDYVRSAYKRYINYYEEIYSDAIEETTAFPVNEESTSVEQVLRAMKNLRPDYQIILNLYAVDNMSHAEIAKRLQIKEASSRSKLLRARNALKKLLRSDKS